MVVQHAKEAVVAARRLAMVPLLHVAHDLVLLVGFECEEGVYPLWARIQTR